MRIGIYLNEWNFGGVHVFSDVLSKGLVRRGHDVTLVFGIPFPKRNPVAQRGYEELARTTPCRIHCLGLSRFQKVEQTWRAFEDLQRQQFDVLFLNFFEPLADCFHALSAEVPLVAIAHSDDDYYYYREFSNAHSFATRYVAVSPHVLAQMRRLCDPSFHPRLLHIPYGVPVANTNGSSGPTGELKVLFAGRLDNFQKRVFDLPLIWRRFLELGGRGRLTLCGAGKDGARLRRRFDREVKAGTVVFQEHTAHADMAGVFHDHDVILSASNFEGLPLTILEASMHGLYPVLSETKSGHPEIVASLGEGKLCHIGDVDGFARELKAAADNVAELRRKKPDLRERAEKHYGAELMVAAYERLATETCDEFKQSTHRPVVPEDVLAQINSRPNGRFLRRTLAEFHYRRHYRRYVGK